MWRIPSAGRRPNLAHAIAAALLTAGALGAAAAVTQPAAPPQAAHVSAAVTWGAKTQPAGADTWTR